MSFDIYGNRLERGFCEVHPHVRQECPCDLCLTERQRPTARSSHPKCGICGKFEACTDSCGVPVCSEACYLEARREHDGRENDPMVAGLRWHVEALDRACRMALEALTLVTDAGEDEAERWSVSGGDYEGVKCVAAINAIRAAIPMRHEELADGWCVPEVKE